MSWEQFKTAIKGKKFLIGITFRDDKGQEIEQFQTSGIVRELTDTSFLIFEQDDGGTFKLFYDPKSIEVANHKIYREKSTGQVIENPDYITEWDVNISDPNSIAEIKANGFPE